jgi:hypothetical protein
VTAKGGVGDGFFVMRREKVSSSSIGYEREVMNCATFHIMMM